MIQKLNIYDYLGNLGIPTPFLSNLHEILIKVPIKLNRNTLIILYGKVIIFT